jgi:hypothetical protein
MDQLFQNPDEGQPDLATPINSQGGRGNGAGGFNLKRSLQRKVKSREDLSQPKRESFNEQNPLSTGTNTENNAVDRYFGAFSIESKRHVWDLLGKHPEFGDKPGIRMNRIRNNTTEVLPNDPFRNVTNGGYTVYEHPENNDANIQRPSQLP